MSDYLWNSEKSVCAIGDIHPNGTYMYLIKLSNGISIPFGRFKKGKEIHLSSGYYVYIGSALSKRGSTSLGNRLSRHLRRNPGLKEHQLRPNLIGFFDEIGITYARKPSDKTLFWNIDHLNNLTEAEIIGVIFIRNPVALENSWSEFIEKLDVSHVFEKGLGANDSIGHTHVQKIILVNGQNKKDYMRWWGQLPSQLPRIV